MKSRLFVALIVVFFVLLNFIDPASNVNAEAKNIVKEKKLYTYLLMERDLKAIAAVYPDLVALTSIGKSEFDREIYAISIGTGKAAVFVNASHHAREYFTTAIVMNQIQDLLIRADNDQSIAELLQHVTIWVVPMVNPDGVSLAQNGYKIFPELHQEKLIKMNNDSTNFKNWKANANGIDLNRQYPADWENIKQSPKHPSSYNYKGSKALETKENQALVEFTYEIEPQLAISNHSTGRIIFWNFLTPQENVDRDQKLANELSKLTGYSLVKPSSNPSGGGYTDWFITEFGMPAFTPEMSPSNEGKPVSLSYFEDEWNRNKEVLVWAAKSAYKLWYEKQLPSFQEVDRMITLSAPVKMYKAPNINDYSSVKLTQTEIKVKGQWGHWFLIDTWLGDQYIYLPNEPLLETEPEIIAVDHSVTLHPIPYEGSKKLAVLSPQKIKVIKRMNNWVKIDSWIGEVWFKLEKTTSKSVE